MKKIFYLLFLITPAVLFANESQQTGDWENNATWVGNAPGYTFDNNTVVTIKLNHIVETDLDVELIFNNNATIDVVGTLIINGNITVNNNLSINIAENSNFIINGNLYLNNNGTIDVDGSFYVDTISGNNINTNSITGDGVVYTNEISGVDYDDFDGIIVSNPLPVSLLTFDLLINEDKVAISWSTATEINNDYFTIEHSIDGQNWDVISYVNGAGNSNEIKDYELIDENPVSGTNYYRLKQTDFDGSYEYFSPEVIFVNNSFNESKILDITFNHNLVNIWFENAQDFATILIADLNGRILRSISVKSSDQPQELVLDLSSNYTGNIIIVNLSSKDSSSSRKVFVR